MRRLTMAAAAVVGATGGGAALGDDHVSGGHVDCSDVSWDCYDECLELKICLEIPETGGIDDCASERSALAACEAGSGGGPGGGSGGGVIIVPACPAGQHYHEDGGCQADHECGDDEIGGGDEDCEACPDGEVPNEDGTACVTCEHGERAMKPGTCACDQKSVDDLAIGQLKNVAQNPWEHFEKYYCAGGLTPSVGSRTYSTNGQEDVCSLDATSEVMSWAVSSIGVGHSHPYFDPAADYSGANRVQCGVDTRGNPTYIDSASKARYFNMVAGKMFSPSDMQWSKPTYLVVPERDEVKVYRPDEGLEETIWKK